MSATPHAPAEFPPLAPGAFVETHCHLDDRRFESDRAALVERALAAGIGLLVSIGTGDGPPDLEAGIRMADTFAPVYASVGVHPHDASKATAETWAAMRDLASHPKVLLLGEMGLDYFYDHSPREVQKAIFQRQLELAAELGRPISIHTRDAWADTVACIREVWGSRHPGGIFHCFSGGPAEAQEALALGFHLGIGGVLTFPKAEELRAAVAATPLNRLLLETDAPYLAPIPFRGKRNEPAYLVHTATRIGELHGVPVEEVAATTTKNFQELVFAAKLANQ